MLPDKSRPHSEVCVALRLALSILYEQEPTAYNMILINV